MHYKISTVLVALLTLISIRAEEITVGEIHKFIDHDVGTNGDLISLSSEGLHRFSWFPSELVDLPFNARATVEDPAFLHDGSSAVAVRENGDIIVAWFGVRPGRSIETYLSISTTGTALELNNRISILGLAAIDKEYFVAGVVQGNDYLIHRVNENGEITDSFHSLASHGVEDPSALLGNVRLVNRGSSLFLSVLRSSRVYEYSRHSQLLRTYDFELGHPDSQEDEGSYIESMFQGKSGEVFVELRRGKTVSKENGNLRMVEPRRVVYSISQGETLIEQVADIPVYYQILSINADGRIIARSLLYETRGDIVVFANEN